MKKPFQIPVNCSRGAPMGRYDNRTESQYPVKFHLQCMPMVNYCYDEGGAYWGAPDYQAGIYPLYCAWGDGAEEQQRCFLRAASRDKAKADVRSQFANCKFYR